MSFESGTLSCRFFSLPRKLPADALQRFAEHAPASPGSVSDREIVGWVTGRHLLDRHITEETALYGGYIRLNLCQIQKKIPPSLLQAECRMEELAIQAADGKPFLNRQERSDVKKSVMARLLPQMPPQLNGVPVIFHPDDYVVCTSAVSVKQSDLIANHFTRSMGYSMAPLTPEHAALLRKSSDAKQWKPCSFSESMPDDMMESSPGRDFITWLWYLSENGSGTVTLDTLGDIGLLIEGPLVMTHEGGGAHEVLIKNGDAAHSAEAKTCLKGGKKLKKARCSFTCGEEVWTFVLDANEFVFSGLRLPDSGEFVDAISKFQERMIQVKTLYEIFFKLYDRFVDLRKEPQKWKVEKDRMREWIKGRPSRF